MNPYTIRVLLLALTFLVPLAAAEGGPWTVRTADDGTTYAVATLVRLQWAADTEPTTAIQVTSSGIALFSLLLPMEDLRGVRQSTTYETEGPWFKVGVPPEPVQPLGDVSLGVHDAARLGAVVQCAGHPPEPVRQVEPCAATFPEGSAISLARDGDSLQVRLPDQADGTAGSTLSWVGFNPQPEPPAKLLPQSGIERVEGTTVWFTGADIQVTVEGVA